ncbi:hypothetical protein L1987_81516 [Smallanthus sonchifolius]|uniref:Uncharacterized protein n=1 Tax=Smallanthus sonchifolius TaxID=185202 RepID=A0ACB8YRS1_9ASTR|nr:hypothetical protein L1987_81516 [Smallanthus sonchifolius]
MVWRGTLVDFIRKSGRNGLPESDVKRHTRSILCGLRHIHHCGYVHCDLKPENILPMLTNPLWDPKLDANGDGIITRIGEHVVE